MIDPTTISLWQIYLAVADAITALRNGVAFNKALSCACIKLPAEKPQIQALLFLAIRHLALSEAWIHTMARKEPSPAVRSLVTVGLAALIGSHKAPYTITDNIVRAAKARAETASAAGFVNALFRSYQRAVGTDILEKIEAQPEVRFNAPLWWIERIRSAWPETWSDTLTLSKQHPPMTLRINRRQTTPEKYLELLQQNRLNGTQVGLDAITLESPSRVEDIPGFTQGLVSVQDAAAQLAAQILPVKTGDHILDACSAPGGKTAHLLEKYDCRVTALDINENRCERTQETLSRLGLSATICCVDDAAKTNWWDGTPYDAILLDAPCTASGIVRRQPDVPWVRREEDIFSLANTQRSLLKHLWPILKQNGYLLYATCSIFPEEGREQILRFIKNTPNASLIPFEGAPEGLLHLMPTDSTIAWQRTMLPSVHDGLFYALLKKN